MTARTKPLNAESLTNRLRDRQVLRVLIDDDEQLSIRFTCGTVLIVEATPDGLVARVENARASAHERGLPRPTKRQLDYLTFISKYIHRFGRAPAESDTERQPNDANARTTRLHHKASRRGTV